MTDKNKETPDILEILQNQISAQQIIIKVLIGVMIEKEIITDKELSSKLESALKYSEKNNINTEISEDEEMEQAFDLSDEELLKYLQDYGGEFGIS